MTPYLEALRETIRRITAMRDVCARDIADHVIAGDTTSDTFAAAVRTYEHLGAELAECRSMLDTFDVSTSR